MRATRQNTHIEAEVARRVDATLAQRVADAEANVAQILQRIAEAEARAAQTLQRIADADAKFQHIAHQVTLACARLEGAISTANAMMDEMRRTTEASKSAQKRLDEMGKRVCAEAETAASEEVRHFSAALAQTVRVYAAKWGEIHGTKT